MAKHDRCMICDYSQDNGSGLAGINPGVNGRVRSRGKDGMLCDVCSGVVRRTIMERAVQTEAIDGEIELLEELED